MARSQDPVSVDAPVMAPRRTNVLPAAIMLGVPLATGLLALVHYGPIQDSGLPRYVSHRVEQVEVFLFCGALGAFASKLWGAWRQKRACSWDIVSRWNGSRVDVSQAHALLSATGGLPGRIRRSVVGRRTAAILDFLCRRGTANDLDD